MERRNETATLSASKMTKRICDREDNIYNRRTIEDILNMYMDECRKALLSGERVRISKVGTITPEVKVREGNFNLPMCNKDGGNPPYTQLKIRRNNLLGEAMNKLLARNIKNGIYGLEELPFSKKQMNILKQSGTIPEDARIESGDEE